MADAALHLAHVADFYRRHPGETVTFFTRLEADGPLAGLRLRVGVPTGMSVDNYHGPADAGQPRVLRDIDFTEVAWTLPEQPEGDHRFDFQVVATVDRLNRDDLLESRAAADLLGENDGAGQVKVEEYAAISVTANSALLRYLPGLYADSGVMGRYLMLFESFLAPIEAQIGEIPNYFDPKMTPAEMLPWLASWLDLTLEEHWSEAQRRELIASAIQLYRSRGTRTALTKYIELFTGVTPEIVEYRAHNFVLGNRSRLGLGIALGRDNVPHAFTVKVALPPIRTGDEAGDRRQEAARRKLITRIIEMEKPAHAAYSLVIEENPNIQ